MDKTDSELVKEYLNGNEEVLALLVKRYLKTIYNFAYRFVGEDDAEDVTQEVFLKAWKSLKKYHQDKNFKTWILSITRNTSIDWLRKKKSIPFSDFDMAEGGNILIDKLSDPAPLPPELLTKAENSKLLELALTELSPDYRAVLLLRYQENISFKEIGQVLEKPLHTVKSQHRRALIQLRKILEIK